MLITWSKSFDKKPHRMSCRYWQLNDPFCIMPLLTTEWSLLLCTPQQRLLILFNGLKNCPFPRGDLTPFNTWFLGPTRVSPQNSILIDSAVFEGHIIVTNRQTDRQTTLCVTSVVTGCIYAMWPKLSPLTDSQIWSLLQGSAWSLKAFSTSKKFTNAGLSTGVDKTSANDMSLP